MFKRNRLPLGWKYLLIMALFTSANISQAITLTSGDIMLNANNRFINDEIRLDINHNAPLLSTPISIVSFPVLQENPVVFEKAKVVSGKHKSHTGYFNKQVKLKEAGTYQATLSDFDFPAGFDMLGLSISSSTEKMGEVWSSGSFSFEAEPGKYFLGLIYKTDEILNLGMYGVKLSYLDASPVPLPAALWLMLTGVMALVGYQRIR